MVTLFRGVFILQSLILKMTLTEKMNFKLLLEFAFYFF